MKKHKTVIKTPHAAVLIWNYNDRLSAVDTKKSQLDSVEKTILSTVSCVSIQTLKSKSDPAGTFSITLAPTKNWTSTITPGSWCCILMSNEPITKTDIENKVNQKHLKMIGRIESVRVSTRQDGDTRRTLYTINGSDWGYMFKNIIYVDNLIASANEPKSQGNTFAVALRNIMMAKDGATPEAFAVRKNLQNLIDIFGESLPAGLTEAGEAIGRLAKSIYDFRIPAEMMSFLGLGHKELTKNLNLITGPLVSSDKYDLKKIEALGFIDPFSLQGSHSFWEVLLENSNPALNEMISEIRWINGKPSLTLYNRIKPFSTRGFKAKNSTDLRSFFQYVKTHSIDGLTVTSIDAGTNWRDKYNFVEIKPQFQDFAVFNNWIKQKTQEFDQIAFNREGFRPLIVGTKQFPYNGKKNSYDIDFDRLNKWTELLREWYFNTHKMLNGTLTMTGTTDYIAVGDNIRFEAGLINLTPNINENNLKKAKNDDFYILAHVENIAHSFSVKSDGARTYTTTIQFVRGILVNKNNQEVSADGAVLDSVAWKVNAIQDKNTATVFANSDSQDPDSKKVRGQ
jgi:hypothetical protein